MILSFNAYVLEYQFLIVTVPGGTRGAMRDDTWLSPSCKRLALRIPRIDGWRDKQIDTARSKKNK